MVIISTSAVLTSIQAVSPESILAASAVAAGATVVPGAVACAKACAGVQQEHRQHGSPG